MSEETYSEKELAIIEAARKRFAYYGFGKATMDEIAADVGLGKASLYYYFPAKEALFDAVILHEQDEFIDNIRAMLAGDMPAPEKLRAFAATRISYFSKLINLSTVTLEHAPEVKQAFHARFTEFEARELELLCQLLNDGTAAGVFIPGAADSAKVILHALHGLRMRAVRDAISGRLGEDASSALIAETRQLIELILQGIRNTDR